MTSEQREAYLAVNKDMGNKRFGEPIVYHLVLVSDFTSRLDFRFTH